MKIKRLSLMKRISVWMVVYMTVGIGMAENFSWLEEPASDNWNTTDFNWSGAGTVWGNTQADNANFGSSDTQNITADTVMVSNIVFNADGYAIGGGPLNLFGDITVSDASQTAAITAPIMHATADLVLSKHGAGTLVLNPTGVSASNNFASLKAVEGTLHITGGTNVVTFADGTASAPAFWVCGGTLVMGGGVLKTTAAGAFGGYSIVGNGGTLLVTNGLVDLTSTKEFMNAFGSQEGTTTVGGNGVLDIHMLRLAQNVPPFKTQGVININTGGTIRLDVFYICENSARKATVNFNGGTIVAKKDYVDFFNTGHPTWAEVAAYVLEGGAVFETAGNNITIKQDLLSGAADDGGLTKKDAGTLSLRGANAYRGGNFLWAGGLNITNDNNLGAVPDVPATNVTFVGNSSLMSGGTHVLDANRTIRIPENVTAFFDTQSYTQTVKSVIFGEGGDTTLIKQGTGTLEIDPGDDALGFSIGTLKAKEGVVYMRSGSNFITTASGVPNSTGFLLDGGTVLIGGGVLQTTGGGRVSNKKGTLIITNGIVDFSRNELLNAHGGTGRITVSGNGVLDVDTLRVTQWFWDISNNVVNVNTDGTIRLNNFYVHTGYNYIGMINLNGGTLVAKTTTENFLGDGDPQWLTNIFVNVLAGGAIVDTNDKDISIKQSLYAGAAVDGGLTKQGTGTLTLMNTNTYTGVTAIEGGMLKLGRVDALLSANTVTVSSNAVFDINGITQLLAGIGGGGMVTNLGALTVTDRIAPGDTGSCGTLTLAESPASLSDCTLAVNVSTNGSSDSLYVQGDLDLSTLSLSIEDTAQLNQLVRYTVASCTGKLDVPFAAVSPLPQRWKVMYNTYNTGIKKAELVYNPSTVIMLR